MWGLWGRVNSEQDCSRSEVPTNLFSTVGSACDRMSGRLNSATLKQSGTSPSACTADLLLSFTPHAGVFGPTCEVWENYETGLE